MISSLLVASRILDFPQPPPDIERHSTNTPGQTVLFLMIAGSFVAVYVVALWFKRRYGTWIPLAVVAGSTFSAVIEPLPDAVANLWYSPGQNSIWTSYGNSIHRSDDRDRAGRDRRGDAAHAPRRCLAAAPPPIIDDRSGDSHTRSGDSHTRSGKPPATAF
jgi:hypothetical protein